MSNDPRHGILPVQSYELNHQSCPPHHGARHDAPTVVAAPPYAYYQQQYYGQQPMQPQVQQQPYYYQLPAYLEPAASPVPAPPILARGSEPVITPAAAEKKAAKDAARAAAREALAAKKQAERAAADARREAAKRAVVEKQDAKREAEAKKLADRQSVVSLKLADQHAAETNQLVSRHASASRRLREMQHAEAKRLAEKQAASTRALRSQQEKEARRYAKPGAKAKARGAAPLPGSGVSLETRPGKPVKADSRLARAKTVKPELARGVEANAESRNRRLRFVRLTYVHLLFALGAFGALLYALTTVPVLVENVSTPLVTFALGGRWNWGAVLGAFMVVSFIADYAASHTSSGATHYLGLLLYIVAEALIFVPLLAIVEWKTHAILARGGAEPHILRDAAVATGAIFTALTLSVLFMRRDFSILKSALVIGTAAAAVLIGMSLGFGFQLGLAFSVGMILLAGAYILYQTSEVLARYDTRHHVAASLALFASVALMFWYVIRVITRARE